MHCRTIRRYRQARCHLSVRASVLAGQVAARSRAVSDLGPTELKNIAEPVRVYSLQLGVPAQAKSAAPEPDKRPPPMLAISPPFRADLAA